MSFSAVEATLCFLIKIVLPSQTITYAEGGTVVFNGDTYTSNDSVFGSITGFENFSSGAADEAPEYSLDWTPPSTSAAATLSDAENQSSPVKAYVVTIDRATGAVLTSKTVLTGIVDSTALEISEGFRVLKMTISTEIDRFLNTDKGNRINAAFHKSIYPGETGLDMATGTKTPVPWGDKTPARQNSGGSGGGGGNNSYRSFEFY